MGSLKRFIFIGGIMIAIILFSGNQAFKTVKEGAEAYIFGYSMILMDVTQKVMTAPESGRPPVNHFAHIQFYPDHTFREVVRPNNDTLYSTAWFDLSSGPLVLSVPDTAGRYYVMPFMDAWTNVFAMVGKRLTGTEPGDFLVVGPDWKGELPEGLEIIQSPTNRTWLIGRIQTNGMDDFQNVFNLQKHFTLTKYENWPHGVPNPSISIKKENPDYRKDPLEMVDSMSAQEFFSHLSRLMGEQPPSEADAPTMKMLGTFDIKPGEPFDIEALGVVKRALLKKAVQIARKKLHDIEKSDRSSENNWAVLREGIGNYGTNYGIRSLVSLIGLGALPPAEAAYPNANKDINGDLLSGRNEYYIHFDKNQTPPVDAFWSLTMYDERGFLVNNAIQRYTIGDRDKLEFNEDGSLDILIQNSRPEKKESNWLPAPDGNFAVTMRLYMPKKEFLNKEWKLPPINRVPK